MKFSRDFNMFSLNEKKYERSYVKFENYRILYSHLKNRQTDGILKAD